MLSQPQMVVHTQALLQPDQSKYPLMLPQGKKYIGSFHYPFASAL